MLKSIAGLIKNSKQFKNLVIYGIGQGFNLITPLLVVPYIVSICGEEGYGKIGVGMALAFFIMVFIDYGSEIVGVKDVAVNRENNNKLETIFMKFYRLEKTQPVVTGLGLFITRGFVEAQGGIIKAMNLLNSGALFIIDIPTIILPQTIHHE